LKLYTSAVLPKAVYACETWKSTVTTEIECVSPEEFPQNCGVAWTNHVINLEVLKPTDQRPLQDNVQKEDSSLQDTVRQAGTRPSKRAMNWIPVRVT